MGGGIIYDTGCPVWQRICSAATSRCVPHRVVSPHTPAMLYANHTSSSSRRDSTPTSFFRVMNRLSKGFRFRPSYRAAVEFLYIAIHVTVLSEIFAQVLFSLNFAVSVGPCKLSARNFLRTRKFAHLWLIFTLTAYPRSLDARIFR